MRRLSRRRRDGGRRALRAAHLVSLGSFPANVEMAFVCAPDAPALVARVALAPRRTSSFARATQRAGAARAASRSHRVSPRAAQKARDAATTTAERPSSSVEPFDDPLATQFKRMYATPGKRIKWGVFKEDVGETAVSETDAHAARDAAAASLTNIDGDERARRGLVGRAFVGVTLAIAAAQVATHQPASARALIALPLFFAVGFLGSERTGL